METLSIILLVISGILLIAILVQSSKIVKLREINSSLLSKVNKKENCEEQISKYRNNYLQVLGLFKSTVVNWNSLLIKEYKIKDGSRFKQLRLIPNKSNGYRIVSGRPGAERTLKLKFGMPNYGHLQNNQNVDIMKLFSVLEDKIDDDITKDLKELNEQLKSKN